MRIFIGVPNLGKIHPSLSGFLQFLSWHSFKRRSIEFSTQFHVHKPIEHTRNHFVNLAIAGNFDALWMIDSDNTPAVKTEKQIESIFQLLLADHAIVAFPTPMWRGDRFSWNCMRWRPEHDAYVEDPHPNGLHPCDLAGSGSIVIARRVLEDERIQPLFEREWYKDGTQKYSSDYVFSRKARAKGWEILCSWDHLCHHFKTADFLELIQIYGAPDDLYGIRLLDKETGEFEPAPSIAIAAKEEVASA